MKFEMPSSPLAEHALRHIIREAENRMADGQDAKTLLVEAAQEHLAMELSFTLTPPVVEAVDMAGSLDAAPADYIKAALPDIVKQIGEAEFDKRAAAHDFAPAGSAASFAYALAAAAVRAKPVMPMNRGKFLSKLGIVDAHVKALVPATTAPAPEAPPAPQAIMGAPAAEVEQPDITDPDMREMLGLAPLPAAEPAPAPLAGAPASAPGAAPPPMTNGAAPSAAPADAPPPPAASNARDAFTLLREGTEVDDAELAKRLGISRSTFHNYMSGRTAKVKLSPEQARVMAAECDVRVAKLRQAAEIFGMIR